MKIHFLNWKNCFPLSFASFFLYNLLWLMIDGKDNSMYNEEFQLTDLIWEFLFCIGFTTLSLFYSYLIFRFLFSPHKPYSGMIAYAFILFLLNTLVAWITTNILDILFGAPPGGEALQMKSIYSFGMIASFVSFIYSNTFYLESYIKERGAKRDLELQLLKEKEITLNSQLNVLKLQINPHFMFNNFSILSELIEEDKTLAGDFLAHLSSVYRYIIQNMERNTVPIAEEIKFLSSYIYLMKMRYENSVDIHIAPDMDAPGGYMPPASLQLLVENAIKHNRRSKAEPLSIEIQRTDSHIVVRNPIRPILSETVSTGIGLKNIVERYSLLCDKPVDIEHTETDFTVSLPIL